MSKSNNMINWYEHKDVKKLVTKYHNPCFPDTQINIPARIGIIAASGGFKTQFLLNYIAKSPDTWSHIFVVYKASEPLYEFLRDKIGTKAITFFTKLSDLPAPKDINIGQKQVLLVFDDQVVEKDQKKIEEYFIRGRKIGGGITMCYLSQSFFAIPTLIRRQFNYLIILKLSGSRDLNLILRNYSLGLNIEDITKIYKDATKEKGNFLKIDCECRSDNKKYSKNWTSFYHVDDDSDED
ncbi:MAG: hypothetical protein H7263_16075 [Candidatus Sericytochromatia bacterium]|nr:hypothetical protein [Candidatus Sericytochromatia bacterium]